MVVHRDDAALIVQPIAELFFDRDRALRGGDFVRHDEIHEDERVAAGEFLNDVGVEDFIK